MIVIIFYVLSTRISKKNQVVKLGKRFQCLTLNLCAFFLISIAARRQQQQKCYVNLTVPKSVTVSFSESHYC